MLGHRRRSLVLACPYRRHARSSRVVGRRRSASAPAASRAASQPASAAPSAAAGTIKVFGAFATEIEEPWDGVIHTALEDEKAAGRIDVLVHGRDRLFG